MEQAVPLIYTRDALPPPLRGWMRLLAAAVALGCLTILAIGAWLTPDGNGVGTHTQLGLERCGFEARTGVPCLTCGFTTSVSHFAHGNVLASLYLQPMGFVVAVFCAATVWIGMYIAVTGRPVHRLVDMLPARGWLIALLTLTIGAWAWKILIHLMGRDRWPL